MEKVSYHRTVECVLRMSVKEVKTLADCARRHYDSKCKDAAEHGGFIYGILNKFSWQCGADVTQNILLNTDKYDEVVCDTFPLPEDQIQTLTKIAEQSTSERLHSSLIQILREVHWEESRVNDRCPECNSPMPKRKKEDDAGTVQSTYGMDFCSAPCVKNFHRRHGK